MIEYCYSSDTTNLKQGDSVVYIGTSGKSLRSGVVIRRTPKGFTVGNPGSRDYVSRRFDQVAPL